MNRARTTVGRTAGRGHGEPSVADLAAIEAEWPLIAAGLAVVAAEVRLAVNPGDGYARPANPSGAAVGLTPGAASTLGGGVMAGAEWWADCEVCEASSAGAFVNEQAAVQAAGGHDDRYHAGRPTAVVLPMPPGHPVFGQQSAVDGAA